MKNYDFAGKRPVAKFFYKGKHTHPVMRTIIVVDSTDHSLTGYELREGKITRKLTKAPIKTFLKTRIARVGQVDARRPIRATAKKVQLKNSTLQRESLADFIRQGV